MAENRTYNDSPTFIPARLESAVHGLNPVADAKDIYDIEHQKWQKEVNQEVEEQGEHLTQVDESLNSKYDKNETYSKTEVDTKESGLQGQINTIKGGSTKSIATLDNEINGTGGINQRLEVVEELGTISVGGGNIGIATEEDFGSDTPTDLAKVPTVGAIQGGLGDGVYNISARHNGTKYADLAAALGVDGANIPQSLRKGGMSVKFVQSSDNTYVQYMFTSTNLAYFANVAYWERINIDQKLIKLVGIAGNATAAGVSQVRDIYFNTANNELRKCVSWGTTAADSSYITIPFIDGAIYSYNNGLFVYDGTTLVPTPQVVKNNLSGHIDIVVGNSISPVASVDDVTDLSESIATSKNLLDKEACVVGAMNGEGVIGSQAYYRTTDYIRLKSGEKIISSANLLSLFEYDLDKNIILPTRVTNITTHTQVNDGYIRASFDTENLDSIQIEKGETATPYSSYQIKLSNSIALNDSHIKDINTLIDDAMHDVVTANKGLPVTADITNDVHWENGYGYNLSGVKVTGNYKCIRIPVTYQDIIKLTASTNARFLVVFNEQDSVITSDEYGAFLACPQGASYAYITYSSAASVTKIEKTTNALINNAMELTYSTNYFDTSKFTNGYSINPTTGEPVAWNNGGYTDYIPVKTGQIIVLGDGIFTTRYIRRIAAYNDLKVLVPAAGSEGGDGYVVPEGVSFVRLSIVYANIFTDSRINLTTDGKLLAYEPFSVSLKPIGTSRFDALSHNMKYCPLTTIPSFLNASKYKPLGVLSKPYICITSDDGTEKMATRSIPLSIEKDIPITYYIMTTSEVLLDSSNITLINNAIASGNCELGQHGDTPYVDYTEEQLRTFFAKEKETWDTLGFTMKSSAPPTSNSNDMVNALCGTTFGVNRNADADLYYGGTGCYANGPRSNIYALSSLGIKGHSLATNKGYIDDACNNNWLLVIHYHDFDLDNVVPSESTMTLYEMLEEIIEYAKTKGMTFIKASEIETII